MIWEKREKHMWTFSIFLSYIYFIQINIKAIFYEKHSIFNYKQQIPDYLFWVKQMLELIKTFDSHKIFQKPGNKWCQRTFDANLSNF